MGTETDGVSPRISNMYLMKEAKYISRGYNLYLQD